MHYISEQANWYEQAIISVGGIIQDYDSDKQFPVLGFGARIPPDGRVSHEFFVNMDQSNPYCNGINGKLMVKRFPKCSIFYVAQFNGKCSNKKKKWNDWLRIL